MFRVINEYMSKVNLKSGQDIYSRLDEFLKNYEGIKKYSINVSFNQYVIDIKLKDFNIENANTCFKAFNSEVSYEYSSLYLRFNEGKCVRYRYITSTENKDAFYCDIVFG